MAIQIISIIVALGVAFYFLRREHRKSKAYFGEKVEPTRQEKKILEKYRQEYEPIAPDSRLADLEKDKWELEDIAKSATEIVYTSPIPSRQQRENLKAGDLVKLKFIVEEDGETEVERMWVKVTGKADGLYSAELDNDPFNDILKAGQPLWFHANHVFEVDADRP